MARCSDARALTAALAAVVLFAAPAAAQIDFDIAGFWDQPAAGTVNGPELARALTSSGVRHV